jgi:hypothetical protein
VDDTIRSCWRAICSNNVSRIGDQFLVLDGSNVAWGAHYSSTKKLLEREEYFRVFDAMKLNPHLKLAYLSGTKGIGKTIFLFWLIYKLVSTRETDLPIPSFLLMAGKGGNKCMLRCNNSNPEVIVWNGEPIDYMLSDVSYDLCIVPRYWSLLVSSYGATEPKPYTDAVLNYGRQGLSFVMGTLSRDEIIALAPNPDVGDFSFLIFGGSARMLSEMSSLIFRGKVVSNTHRSDVQAIMEEFLADSEYMDVSYRDLIDKACDVICSQMILTDSTPQAIQHSLFTHYIVEPDARCEGGFRAVPVIASTFMEYYASFLVEESTADALKQLRDLFTSSGIGNLFERQVLKTIFEKYKKGGELDAKRMYPSGYTRTVTDRDQVNLNVKFTRKVFIQTIGDIERLNHGELGIPCTTNFPLVDFVLKPIIRGQITRGKTHPCAYERHTELEKAMGEDSNKGMFVFFCDQSNYDSFRYDNKLLPEVKQYKVLAAWTAKRKRPYVDIAESGTSSTAPAAGPSASTSASSSVDSNDV